QATRAVQFGGDVVDQLLVGGHTCGLATLRDGVDDGRIEAGFDREPSVGMPLVLRAPLAGGDADRQLVQLGRDRAAEADRLAELLDDVADVRRTQPDVERSAERSGIAGAGVLDRAASAGAYGVAHGALRGCELFERDLLESLRAGKGILRAHG